MPMAVRYTTVDGQVLCENRGGVKTLFMPDTLGNVIETRNMDTGAQTSSTTYWPYGEVRTQTGTNPSPLGFCGVWGYYTQAGQPTYVRARYYRPHLGRWQTVDPLWPWENAYRYAYLDPEANIDPSGEKVYLCKGTISPFPVIGEITHWYIVIDGPHCPRIRIDFSYNGILIGQRAEGDSAGEDHRIGLGDKCFDLGLTPAVEKCMCKSANEFRTDRSNDKLGGNYWRKGRPLPPLRDPVFPYPPHPIPKRERDKVPPIWGDASRGEYNFVGRNCQHFAITLIQRCGGPTIPDEASRIKGGSSNWGPPVFFPGRYP